MNVWGGRLLRNTESIRKNCNKRSYGVIVLSK
jgi:hypothetical protein